MTSNQLRSIAALELSSYNWRALGINKKKAIEFLENEILTEFNDLNKAETKEVRFNHFNLPNTKPDDYSEHLIEIKNSGWLKCGIRHFSGQKTNAFIKIQPSFSCSADSLCKIYDLNLRSKFEMFNPGFIQFFTAKAVKADELGLVDMVQRAAVIKKLNIANSNIEFNTPADDSYYEQYYKEYQLFHKEQPSLAQKVPVNSKEMMEESRKKGLLKAVYIKGEFAGLIAALPELYLGNAGIYFIEFLLVHKWRRKGFAKHVQRSFVQQFINDNHLVWGTIDQNNAASLNTALGNSRVGVRFENFVSLGRVRISF